MLAGRRTPIARNLIFVSSMKFKFTLLSIVVSCFHFAFGQGDLRIGEWSQHLPYNEGRTVTQSPTRIYYGTKYALLSVSKEDSSKVEFFSKVDGLSDAGARWIKYHHNLGILIIGYENGNIDLLDSNGTTNINDIQRNNSIQGDKAIKNIFIDDGPLAYLSLPFGLVVLDLVSHQFSSTVFTNSPVFGFTKFQNKFYVSTGKGVYEYDPASGNIIEDFSQWTKITNGLPSEYTSQAIAVFKDSLYAGINGDLYKF